MLTWLAQNTVIAAALAGLILLLCRLASPRPAVRHALWLLVLLKLITPPLVFWPWAIEVPLPVDRLDSLPNVRCEPPQTDGESPTVSEPPAPSSVFAIGFEQTPEADDLTPSQPVPLPDERPGEGGLEAPLPSETESHELFGRLLLFGWLGGSAIAASLQLARIVRFRRRLAMAEAGPSWLMRLVEELADQMRVRPPPVLVVPGLGSPSLWSLGRPRLLWPESLVGKLPPHCRAGVVAHELAHLKRGDHWVGRLRLLTGCVWWWNPLYWFVCRELSRNAELACDAWVVTTLPSERRAYAEALIEVIQWVSQTAAPAPALGMGASRRDIERRLTMIMQEHVPSNVPVKGLILIGLLALAILPGWTLGQQAPRTDPQQTPVADPAPVYYELVQSTAKPATSTADSGRDQRLEALERQLQALLKEVQSLKGSGKTSATTKLGDPQTKPAANWTTQSAPARNIYSATLTAPKDASEVTLVRATYKLPKEKADALAGFLREHVKSAVLETRVDGDNFIVTTTPDSQRAIGQFIAFVQGKPATGSSLLYQYQAK